MKIHLDSKIYQNWQCTCTLVEGGGSLLEESHERPLGVLLLAPACAVAGLIH